MVSENTRDEVIDYLQCLIQTHLGIEVLLFGSVPLKTYLPDGDIDLTVICPQNTEEELAGEICNVLDCEELKNPEFVIQNVEYVGAQVRVVKCNVQGIAVDISFNQFAGLGALCFLEQVDQLAGKDHLFKRSIILIKAWCYYESRILGAIHGLIATYALDLLVLHILNLFHSSLDGPLSVLYRFLNYYSTFDWDKYCVSLNGPVALSSLPEVVVESPQNDGSDLLLGQKFLKNDMDIFLLSTLGCETSEQAFPVKHLNIIDLLKENNNVGRSVSKASFNRIKFAFSYGAENLREIIMLPQERIGEGLRKFFVNTLERNGMGRRSDVRVPVPVFAAVNPEVSDLSGDYNSYVVNMEYCRQYHNPNSYLQSYPSMSLPQVWNKSAVLQLNHNHFPLGKVEGFVPTPFWYPIDPQPSGTSFGDEEIMMFRGTGAYIPTVSAEETWKSVGTRTFIPGMGFQQTLMPQGTGEDYKPGGTATYAPNMGVEHANSLWTGTNNHYMGVEEKAKLEGDTYSPNWRRNPYRRRYNRGSGRDSGVVHSGLTTRGLMLKSSQKNELVTVSAETERENSSCLNPSAEEFPFLPITGRDSRQTTRGLILRSSPKKEQVNVSSGLDEGTSGCLDLSPESSLRIEQVNVSSWSEEGTGSCGDRSPESSLKKEQANVSSGSEKGTGIWHDRLPKSSLEREQVNVSSESEKGTCGCINLSLEEFPILPSIKRAIPPKTPQPSQPTSVPQHAQKSSPISDSIEFGFFEPLESPRCRKTPDFVSPTSKNYEPPEQQSVPILPYKLEDDEDFPPLCS